MSRSAVISSLALHVGLISWIGWAWTLPAGGGDSGGGDCEPSVFLAETGGAHPSLSPPAPTSAQAFSGAEFVPPIPAETLAIPPTALPVSYTITPITLPASPTIAQETFDAAALDNRTRSTAHRKHSRSGGRPGIHKEVGSAGGGGGQGGGRFVPPQFRVRYKPPYPEEARAQRMEGTTMLMVSIDAAGEVTGVELMTGSGHPVLDRAALAAIRSWRFIPARQDGVAVAARVEVPVRFCFEDRRRF